MDGLGALTFPATTAQLFVVFSFISQLPKIMVNCRVAIERANGDVIAEAKHKDISFTPDTPISRNVIGFQGVTWPQSGQYVVKFYGNNAVIASFPIAVQQITQPPQT